jgi:hypothetical protein
MRIVTLLLGVAALRLKTSPCSVGLHDPFSDEYCHDVHQECDCLLHEAHTKIDAICDDYPGHADCSEAIQQRIAEVDQCIARARDARDAQYNRSYDAINDAMGGRDLFPNLASSDKKVFPYGPFSGECVGECREYDALCAYGACNTQLDQIEHKVSHVTGYAELLELKLNELHTVGGTSALQSC